MSRLLVVQPDSVHADVLCEPLRAHIQGDVAIARSLDDALSGIDECIPDVILLPTLMPPAAEKYLLAYLGTIPGADHVQILAVPQLEGSHDPVLRQEQSLLSWLRQRQAPKGAGAPACDPSLFTQDVITYLETAAGIKTDLGRFCALAPPSMAEERRDDPRFGHEQVPWISVVTIGDARAALINVSARGALLRTDSRPEHHFLEWSNPNGHEQARISLAIHCDHEVQALGRVIRCAPLRREMRTQYDVAFLFDQKAAKAERLVERLELARVLPAETGMVVLP